MTLTEIKQILQAGRIQLTKALGQNFLHDANQLRRIIAAAELSELDRALEIGPGLGALTQLLTAKVPEVLAIEKDQRLYRTLLARLGARPGLTLLHADALDYLRSRSRDWTGWKLVSNLPYSVASPILVEFAKAARGPERMVVTVQLEVARRLAATAGQEDYGVLTLLVQLQYEPGTWFKIPPSCFYPVPEIDSACITLLRRTEPLLPASRLRVFEKLVKRGFSQRRKMMLKLLKTDWPLDGLQSAFAQLGISSQTRAEAVTLEQFVALANLLASKGSNDHDIQRNL